MERVVIFIPGITGSRLKQANDGSFVWHENLYDSYRKLSENPSLFKLSTNLTADGVLSSGRLLGGLLRYHFCTRLKEALEAKEKQGAFLYREFAYDWRQHLFNVAREFGEWTCEHFRFQRDQQGRQHRRDDIRLSIVAHSMGGIVAALALMRTHVNPYNVDRFIAIGTPFLGAPAAFRALFELGYLPGLTWVERFVNYRLDRRGCRRNMRSAFQSFPSMFQLLPHEIESFVEIENRGRIHPFRLENIDRDQTTAARDVHNEMTQFSAFIDQQQNLDFRFIYTNDRNSTDSIYEATAEYTGYRDVRCRDSTSGDGTVVETSATLNFRRRSGQELFAPITGAKHIKMCL